MAIFDIRTNYTSEENLKEGTILVAQPFLDEFFFKRSCILMTKMSKGKPSAGFVLNNKTEFFLDELITGISSDNRLPVFCGGPLSLDRLFYIHDITNLPDALPVTNGLFLNGNLDSVVDYINSAPECNKHIKFFIGYCGWDPGQLENELKIGTWAVLPRLDNALILNNTTDNDWENAVKLLGKDFLNWLLFPVEPLLN